MSSIQKGKMGSSDFKPTKPDVKKGSIFDKLTDSNQYTGSHKNRFGSDGKGLGKEGRDLGALGRGTISSNVSSLPDSTNSGIRNSSPTRKSPSRRSPSKMGSSDFKPTKPDVKKGSIFDKLTDSNQYTGSHKNRFDAQGRGRGMAGRDLGALGGGTSYHSVSSYPERT